MSNYKIPASVWTDDNKIRVDFNARPWFVQSSLKQIVSLAFCGWSHCEAADGVAIFAAKHNEDVKWLFQYIEKVGTYTVGFRTESLGFECRVDRNRAITWLRLNRPKVFRAVLKAELEAGT